MDIKNKLLVSYWITFPEDRSFPLGLGVTAYSVEDAFHLLEKEGYDFHKRAKKTEIKEGVAVQELDYDHVVVNSGPIVFRGVWFPCQNMGLGK